MGKEKEKKNKKNRVEWERGEGGGESGDLFVKNQKPGYVMMLRRHWEKKEGYR
jgi:hypothetical protein